MQVENFDRERVFHEFQINLSFGSREMQLKIS